MAKRSKPEMVARFTEEGLRVVRNGNGGGYTLEVVGNVPASDGTAGTVQSETVTKTFENLRGLRTYARKVTQLVDEFSPKRGRAADETTEE